MVTAEGSSFWTPSTEHAYEDPTLDEVVRAYSVFLEVREPKQHKLFEKRLRDNRDAASSEAAIFSWLRSEKLAPRINEEPGKVGADFHCSPATGTPFLLEVTSLNAVSVANQSTWPNRSELDNIAGHFKMVTPQLSVKAIDKARQLSSGYACIPGVLAICLVHPGASALLGTLAAQWLMASEPRIRAPIRMPEEGPEPAQLITDLKYSVFLASEGGMIVPARESISAILLVALWKRQLEVVGMLHPKPTAVFDYRILPEVPFLRVGWPITSLINMEWVVGSPQARSVCYRKVELTTDELSKG